MRFSPPAGMNLYAYTRDSRERETERDKVTQGEKRDICGFPLQGPRRPARFFIRYSGLWCCSCCLLLHRLLRPPIRPGTDTRRLHGLRLWVDLQREIIWKTFDAPSASFPALSHRRPLWWASWQRLGRLAPRTFLSAVVWVSLTERPICCHFCLYTHTESSGTNGVSLQNVISRVCAQTTQDFIPTMAVAVHTMTDCKENTWMNRRSVNQGDQGRKFLYFMIILLYVTQ